MRRTLSFEDRDLLISLVGPETWRVKPENVFVGLAQDQAGNLMPDVAGAARHGCVVEDTGVYLFVGHDQASLCHEYGHAVHALKYPESLEWPDWKAEAFAMMGEARAMRRKGLLSPAQRKDFARHIRASRREGTEAHKLGMKLAFRAVFKHFRPKDQEAYVVNAQTPQD